MMNGKKIKPQFISVPFKADSPNGTMEYHGIAKFSPAGIVIEFESKFFGLISNEVKEVRIALEEIFDIRFRRGILNFFAQIQLRLQDFAKLRELPNDGGKVKLKIKRQDFQLAERAVGQTLIFMNNTNGQTPPAEIDSSEYLPPDHSPVSRLFDAGENETEKLTDKQQ